MPAAGAVDVAGSTSEIRVQFSKSMMDNSWSVVKISDSSFPKIAGKPRYLADGRTSVLPVQLAVGKTYALWLNVKTLQNFKDSDGRAAA